MIRDVISESLRLGFLFRTPDSVLSLALRNMQALSHVELAALGLEDIFQLHP